ncbi:nucleoside-diphosphate kinase [Streptomyces sp. NPDC001787]|uniref:nucleoside-diphosphate kinase n=1 Tax=Streptomyces sp. NPDC001787 TaxID=3154523 RepID=UPI00332FF7E3
MAEAAVGAPGKAPRDIGWDLAGCAWDRLTELEGKDAVFAADIWAREGWSSLRLALGEAEAYRFAGRVAVTWIRPDAFAAGSARRVLSAVAGRGFRVLAARPVRVDPAGARALWAYMCRWATVERLWLLDAVVNLGPGLVVLWADDTSSPVPASSRMTAAKGDGAPGRRREGSLREVAGAVNRVLTMVHSADEPADVVRELAVFFPDWAQRAVLVEEAAGRLADGSAGRWETACRQVEAELPELPVPGSDVRVVCEPGDLCRGELSERWAAVRAGADGWPLLAAVSGPVSWPEQATRSPWR